jgi:hypothetical protein
VQRISIGESTETLIEKPMVRGISHDNGMQRFKVNFPREYLVRDSHDNNFHVKD